MRTKSEYNLHCPFDVKKHKETFVNYLEVIIRPDGTIEYAVPSHSQRLERILAEKLNIPIGDVPLRCPENMYFDYDKWLCEQTGCILMWDYMCRGPEVVTPEQLATIHMLEEEDLYKPYESYCRLER